MERYSNGRATSNRQVGADLASLVTGAAVLSAWLSGDGGGHAARARRDRRGRRRRAKRVARAGLRALFAVFSLLALLVVAGLTWVVPRLVALLPRALRFATTARSQAASASTAELPRERAASSPEELEFAALAHALASESSALPASARAQLRTLLGRLPQIARQLRDAPEQASERGEIRRLLREELPELVRSYRKVPSDLTTAVAFDATPEEQLRVGIEIIDRELLNLQRRLASQDLRALSTQLRYLTLKYGTDAGLDVPSPTPVDRAARVSAESQLG